MRQSVTETQAAACTPKPIGGSHPLHQARMAGITKSVFFFHVLYESFPKVLVVGKLLHAQRVVSITLAAIIENQ